MLIASFVEIEVVEFNSVLVEWRKLNGTRTISLILTMPQNIYVSYYVSFDVIDKFER